MSESSASKDIPFTDKRSFLWLNCISAAFLLFIFLSPTELQAQLVEVDSVSSLDGGQASQFSLSHTIGNGNDRLLIVGITLLDTSTGKKVDTVTYAGVGLTQFKNTAANNHRIQMFRLAAPPSGTATIDIQLEGTSENKAAIGAVSFFRTNQDTPVTNIGTSTGDRGSSSITVSSMSDDMVMDYIGTDKLIDDTAPGSGQTLQLKALAEQGKQSAASTEPGASSVSMDWNFSTTRKFNHVAFNIKHSNNIDTTGPNISNIKMGADAGEVTFSFISNEQLGASSSDLAVSVDGPNTTDVYSFNRNDFSETDIDTAYRYKLTTAQPYDDGQGTYTGAVDDAYDVAGNDGADGTQTDTYNYDTSTNTWESEENSSNQREWSEPNNWSIGVPTSDQKITIPTNPKEADKFPLLGRNDTVKTVKIRSSATVTVDTANSLTVTNVLKGAGSLIVNDAEAILNGNVTVGTIDSDSSNILLDGDARQEVTTQFTVDTLTVRNNSTDGVILKDSVTADSLFTVPNSGAELTLRAGSDIDAHNISGNGLLTASDGELYISGDVTADTVDASNLDIIFDGAKEVQTVKNIPEYQNLTVNNTNSSDRVLSKSNVTVNGTLTLTNGDLVMASETNLLATNRSLSGGKIRFQVKLNAPGWYAMSSPVASNYNDFLDSIVTQGYTGATYESDTLQPNVLHYQEYASGTDNQHWRAINAASDSVKEARGYFVYVFGDVQNDTMYNKTTPRTLEVGGAEFNGNGSTVNFDVTHTDTTTSDSVEYRRGWNLVSNPYGATIDWDDDAKWTKTNMDSVIYVWDRDSNSYLTWNGVDGSLGDGLIAPFQGFWVKANASSPVLKVDNAAKSTGGDFYAKSHFEPASIGFKLKKDSLEQQMHITLSSGASYGKDARDALRLLPFGTDTYLTFYSTLENGMQLSINNLPRKFGKKVSIPVHVGGFKNNDPLNGTYTISWPDFGAIPDEWTLKLRDNENGKTINLRKREFYSFDVSQSQKKKATAAKDISNYSLTAPPQTARRKSDSKERFSLIINPGNEIPGIPNTYKLNSNYPNPFSKNTNIRFATPKKGPVKIMIYDILGRKVKTLVDRTFSAAHHEISWTPDKLASGVYICVMEAGGKQFSRKLTYIK